MDLVLIFRSSGHGRVTHALGGAGLAPQSCFRVGAALLTHLELRVSFLFSLGVDNLPPAADSIVYFSFLGNNLEFILYF